MPLSCHTVLHLTLRRCCLSRMFTDSSLRIESDIGNTPFQRYCRVLPFIYVFTLSRKFLFLGPCPKIPAHQMLPYQLSPTAPSLRVGSHGFLHGIGILRLHGSQHFCDLSLMFSTSVREIIAPFWCSVMFSSRYSRPTHSNMQETLTEPCCIFWST